MSADVQQFKLGMRALASGVTLITTAHGGARRGLTASAVCSVSASPPMLLACVNRSAAAHDTIIAANAFCVNILAEGHAELAKLFSDTSATERRFEAGDWMTGETGVPVLCDAMASFECKVDLAIEKATHTIFIGAVEAVRCAEGAPLLYYAGGFRGLGDVLKAW